ncbi:PREDICTED: olfactory receptor 14A16-like [Condylura cristata]|uniref:olfactory receptor 14A16-like n=1 Tax=Condylura cristata TaxID=143302 RepID=UPI00033430BD|nr:PREDICTED: olfactory receptor 14A16-like [Condylura cristata]
MGDSVPNVTLVTEFLLLGLPEDRALQGLCAGVFLLTYLAAVTGNLLIVALTSADLRLQTPMYFFLRNLSLVDICFISATVPKSVAGALTGSHAISFRGCAAQVFLVIAFAGAEFALLLVMSYDRHAAICRPLHYSVLMSRAACVRMAAASWLGGCVYGSLHAAGTLSVRFCGPSVVHQFFCDIPSLLALACPGEQRLEFAFIAGSCGFSLVCFLLMAVSYAQIFAAVLRIPSAQGRAKTFSTCLPHLSVVALFLSSGFIAYLGSASKSPSSLNLFISALYSLLPPSLNPVIYSLRNRDMKLALGKLFGEKSSADV